MIRLVLFFLPDLLRTAGLALVGVLMVLLIGSRLDVDSELLATPGFIVLMLGFSGGVALQRNSSWIKSIPVNRAGFLAGSFFVSLINLALMLGVYATFILAARSWAPGIEKHLIANPFFAGVTKDVRNGGPGGILILFFVIAAFLMSSFSPFVNRVKAAQWFEAIPLKRRLGYLAAFVAFGTFIMEAGSFFAGCMAILGLMWWSVQHSIQRELALYPVARNAMRGVVMVLLLLQGALVYGLAHRDLRGSDARRAFNANWLLGSLALPIPEERLVQFMNESEDSGMVGEMIRMNPKILSLVNLEVWLKSRSDPKMVLAIEERIQPEDLEKAKIEELLQKYDELKFDPRPRFYLKLLGSKVKAEEAKDFLSSSSRHAVAFGVFACRMWVEQTCVPALIEQVKNLSDRDPFQHYLLNEILRTLSVLKAEHVGFDFCGDVRAEKFKALDWVEPDLNCRDWSQSIGPGVIQTQDEVARWNHCILVALKKEGPTELRIQAVPYLEKPRLDSERRKWMDVLKKAF